MQPLEIRPFEDRDYQRMVEIGAAVDPDQPPSLEVIQYRDRTWNPQYKRHRLVATVADQVIGWGHVAHMWFAYHPQRFLMRIEVDPTHQRRGVGSALYAQLMDTLSNWDAELVRSDVRDTQSDALAFLAHRGFVERQRRWELRLAVRDVDLARFADMEDSLAAQGISITTFPVERARRGERLINELYELEVAGSADEPRPDMDTVMSFDRFVTQELAGPQAMPDGHFLALDGERVVGLSRLEHDPAHARVLHQGFTTTHPTHRGRGIAVALKLRTLAHAKEHGYTEIRTRNDTTNDAMLHINESLGFVKHHAVIIFERQFD